MKSLGNLGTVVLLLLASAILPGAESPFALDFGDLIASPEEDGQVLVFSPPGDLLLMIRGWAIETPGGPLRLSDQRPQLIRHDTNWFEIRSESDRLAASIRVSGSENSGYVSLELTVSYTSEVEVLAGGLEIELSDDLTIYEGPLAIAEGDASRNQTQTIYTERVLVGASPSRSDGILIRSARRTASGVELLDERRILFYDGEVHRTVLKRPEFEDTAPHVSAIRRSGDADTLRVWIRAWDGRPEPFLNSNPGTIPSAFTIIDDADGEDPRKLLAAYYGTSDVESPEFGTKGLLGHGLRTTRTIFGTSRLFDVWDRLHADGIEIGYHTRSPGADLEPQTRADLVGLVPRYGIRHWVDHNVASNPEDINFRGSFPKSEDNPHYTLGLLEEFGFDYAWVEYNMYFGFDAFRDRRQLPHHNSALDDPDVPGRLLVYGRTGGVFFTNYFMSFDRVVTRESLDELERRGGLSLIYTHTCVTGFGEEGADVGFIALSDGVWRIKDEADALFALLSDRVESGRLWVAPASELFDRFIRMEAVSLEPAGHLVWDLVNHGDEPVDDVGLSIPGAESVLVDGMAGRLEDGWIVIAGLDPGSPVKIEAVPQPPETPLPVSALKVLPNPFQEVVTMSLQLDAPGRLRVGVYDVRGRLLKRLEGGLRFGGTRELTWDGRDRNGRLVPSGAYWMSVEDASGPSTVRVLKLN